MAITLNLGNANSAAKISDLNIMLTAINTALDALTAKIAALEAAPAPTATPPSPEGVWNAVATMTMNDRKRLWKVLRDGV